MGRSAGRIRVALVSLGAAFCVAVAAESAQAGTPSAEPPPATGLRLSAASTVAAGSTLTVRPLDQCPPPPDVPGAQPLARISLTRGTSVLASAEVPVSSAGAWSAQLRVPAGTRSGSAQLAAFCFFSPQAEGAYAAYAANRVTVSPAASTLPFTGPRPAPPLALGGALIAVGSALLVVGRRPRRLARS
ncbi:MAG: hypothetical protein QOG64_627 [Acidimicrobiaceae bacterium]|jgi:hypothetical protein|nr:hypothetical protein [Acidimicrobiaceae bacterium]